MSKNIPPCNKNLDSHRKV